MQIRKNEEPYVRRFFAFKEQLLGYIFFDPMFRNNEIIGYYINIERHCTGNIGSQWPQINSLVSYLILEAMKKFKEEKTRYLSLGLSPLHKLDGNMYQENTELKKVLKEFYNQGALYAFQGIARNKARYPAIENCFNLFEAIGIMQIESSEAIS